MVRRVEWVQTFDSSGSAASSVCFSEIPSGVFVLSSFSVDFAAAFFLLFFFDFVAVPGS